MLGLGIGEVILLLIFALIFIGPKKLPDLAKGIGKGVREFHRARQDILEQLNQHSSPSVPETNLASKEPEQGISSEKFFAQSVGQDNIEQRPTETSLDPNHHSKI